MAGMDRGPANLLDDDAATARTAPAMTSSSLNVRELLALRWPDDCLLAAP